jgi:type I restriction enzyme S subunit
MNDLPQSWITCDLKTLLISLESGGRPKGGVRGIMEGVPSIGGEHLTYKGSFNLSSLKYVPKEFANRMNKGHVQKNDILVVKDGATTGKTALVNEKFPFKNAVVNEHVFVCRPSHLVEPKFLFRYLMSKEGQERILENFQGSAQGGINLSFAPNTTVPIAPLPEQRRIITKLEELLHKVDTCRQRLEKIPAILKRFRQSILAAACSGRLTADWRETEALLESAKDFLDHIYSLRRQIWNKRKKKGNKRKYPEPIGIDSAELPDLPESWEWSSADAVCSQITDGEHIQPPYQSHGHPMLSAKHVRNGFVTLDAAGLISETDFRKALERCEPAEGDILIVSVGATTGRAAIVENCPKFAIVRSVLLLKPIMPVRFLLYWVQSPWCFTWMTKASGASAQPHFYIKDSKRMPVPIPPLAEQHEIVRRIEALFKIAARIEERYNKAKGQVDKLTQSILAKAFRGELVPQDPNDEPASELLKKIQNEKDNNVRKNGALMNSKRNFKKRDRHHVRDN